MIRAPIFFAILAVTAPAHAASTTDRSTGWSIDPGGALTVVSRAYQAIDRGDVTVMAEDMQGPRLRGPSDPSRIGIRTLEIVDPREGSEIARISARFSF